MKQFPENVLSRSSLEPFSVYVDRDSQFVSWLFSFVYKAFGGSETVDLINDKNA